MREVFDIVIIGAGPSGSTLARLIDQQYSVCVIEKRNFYVEDDARRKCCGGLISPDAQKMIAKFSLSIPKTIIEDPYIFAVTTFDRDNEIICNYMRNYVNVDREKMDRWLFSMIPEHVTKKIGAVYYDYIEKDDYIEIIFFENGIKKTLRTKYLVGADGAYSKLRKTMYPKDSIRRYISIQQWYEMNTKVPFYTAVFNRQISDFYSWTIPKKNCLLVGSTIELNGDKEIHQKHQRLVDDVEESGFNQNKLVRTEGAFILRPEKWKDMKTGKNNIFLVGESAGFISPSSAEGYSFAFKSAYVLSEIFNNKNISQRSYEKQCVGIKMTLMIKKMKNFVMYNTFVRKIVMKTKVLTITPFYKKVIRK